MLSPYTGGSTKVAKLKAFTKRASYSNSRLRRKAVLCRIIIDTTNVDPTNLQQLCDANVDQKL